MKRRAAKRKADVDSFSLEEKIAIIYLGLYIAEDRIFKIVDQAFYEKKISAKIQRSWKKFFGNEFMYCGQMELKTYRDCAFLEFKARHLMNAAGNLDFDRREPWQGYTIPLENTFFPIA
jgi:hypothetical protein